MLFFATHFQYIHKPYVKIETQTFKSRLQGVRYRPTLFYIVYHRCKLYNFFGFGVSLGLELNARLKMVDLKNQKNILCLQLC